MKRQSMTEAIRQVMLSESTGSNVVTLSEITNDLNALRTKIEDLPESELSKETAVKVQDALARAYILLKDL